ncbi:MAG TPA: VOC family protein [Chitinophagales bacterium]|nr:VOC family protein [Chitinophagales bacterium]
MLTAVCPKIPMRNKIISREFYVGKLGFTELGDPDFMGYLMVKKDDVEIHFFEYRDLDPLQNYGQIYIRTNDIDSWHNLAKEQALMFAKFGQMQAKPWKQKEFSLLDPDHNLLTFGQYIGE